MNRRTQITLTWTLGLLVGVAAWWGTAVTTDGGVVEDVASEASTVRGIRAPGAYWDGAITLNQTVVLPGGAPIQIDLRASLHGVEAAPVDGELRRVWVMQAPQLAVTQGGRASSAADAARNDLPRAFGAAYDARGRLIALYVPPDGDALASGLREQLLSLLQVDAAGGQAWSADEVDPNGTARVRYSRTGERLVREREAYLSVVAGEIDGIAGQARAEVRLGADGWLDAMRAEDAITRRLNADGLNASVSVSLDVDRTGAGLGAQPVWDPAWVRVVPGQGLASESARADLEARVLAGATLSDLLAELRTAEGIDRARLARRVSALLRVDPDQLGAVAGAVSGLDVDDAAMILQGMAQSGVPGAQGAVAGILGAEPRPEVRQAAAVELALAGVYDPAAVAGLQAAARDADADVRDASQLAIGAQVRAGADPNLMVPVAEGFDPKGADALTRLRALGNSGVEATLDVALTALEQGDADVRRAALEALRHVDVPVDDALWAGFGDTNADVRLAAVRAAEAAGGAAVEGLADLATHDGSAAVRAESLRALVSHRADADVRTAAEAASKDPDAGVRAAAAALLGEGGR